MKFINKILLFAALIAFGTACENFDLDLQDNPNAITPDKASVNDLYNSVQLGFQRVYTNSDYVPGAVARMYHAGTFTYEALATANTFNGLWNDVYSGPTFPQYGGLLADAAALKALADERGLDIHGGTVRIMEAYALMVLADLFGSAPYSNAIQGAAAFAPTSDSGADLYGSANKLLDEAIGLLSDTNAAAPTSDIFYDGDAASWITFANTLKMRAALNQRDAGTFSGVLSGGDYIDSASEDFQFSYGSQRDNPNSRHRMYNNHYEAFDGDYLSNYYMWLLRVDKTNADGATVVDPRIRYYFYRKIEKADEQDPTTYSCHFSALPDQSAQPDHWAGLAGDDRLPYCIVLPGDGYSGRDHLNGEGIPPDGPTRTSYGLYPGGGDFDWSDYSDTRTAGTSGGLGQGILPIMLSSFVDFMRAEAALTMSTGEDARALLESGIRASMAKVRGFESLVPATMAQEVGRGDELTTVGASLTMTDEDVDNYVAEVLADYDAASDPLDVVIKEFYLAAWGNGKEAYNMYRRTGYPSNMQPGLEPEVGTFPRSFLLPANHVTRNINATQRALSDRVFWDDGSASVY